MKKFVLVSVAAALLASAGAGTAFAQRPLGDKDHDGVPNVVDPHDDRWDPAWGSPVRAPRGWDHHRHWNHHVSMCRAKYPSYNASRDRYMMKKRWVRCSL